MQQKHLLAIENKQGNIDVRKILLMLLLSKDSQFLFLFWAITLTSPRANWIAHAIKLAMQLFLLF